MAFNLTTASPVLKVRYIGTIREQVNQSSILLDKIQSQKQSVSGKSFTVPLHTSRNLSAGMGRGDGGTLPTAGEQGFTTTVVPNRYLYGAIQITGPTIAASRDQVGAFTEAIESEVKRITDDYKRAKNRQLHSDGTDPIAFWTAADNSTPATVDDGQDNAFVHFVGTDTFDLIDTDNSTKNGDSISFTISLVGSAYSAAWSSGTVSSSGDGDYLVKEDTLGMQMMGIRGIISAGNPPIEGAAGLQGLPVATNDYWKAQVVGTAPAAATNTSLSFVDMQEVIDLVAVNSDYKESDVAFLLCSHGVRRSYFATARAERMTVNKMTLDGGWSALDFNGVGLVADSQCRKNVMYFVNPDTMRFFYTSELDWMDRDGSYLSRVDGQDAYRGVLFEYGNLACLSRNGNGLLQGIVEN